ncbi:MAG: hypothetical protein RIB98_01070 [Acidimicrobiales bacterium]
MRRIVVLLMAVGLVAAACHPHRGGRHDHDGKGRFDGTIDLTLDQDPACEFIGNGCALPFPSNHFADQRGSSGRIHHVEIPDIALPVNGSEASVDASRINANDGFSPGAAALALIPGVDPDGSGLAPITDIARSLDADSGSVVLDATTGERWPHWAELDANATDPDRQVLYVRPAENYENGHRIIVALRDLVDDDGNPIEPTDAFRAYRDNLESDVAEVEDRRRDMDRMFGELERAGVERDDLVLAWEFTVISTRDLTDPLVRMRDDAFRSLRRASPTFTVDRDEVPNGSTYRLIEGTYEVPLYLTGDGSPGNGLNLDRRGRPTVNGTFSSVYRCMIPEIATAADPGRGLVYGHGLLGTRSQTTSTGPRLLAENHNHVVCGTDLIGMAAEDVPHAVRVLGDASLFPTLADRLLQGHLNTLFLGRLMRHADGFASHPAFQDDDGAPRLDTSELGYYGISQGGIMGPVSTAVSTDWDIGVFGVPGMNYSTLLNRSVDFDAFQLVLNPAYPDKADQALLLDLMQMLWDRSEGNGYATYFEEPLRGQNEKRALLHGALGDHQVANVAMDVMARTMGASVVWPAVAPGRSTDVEPFWNIPRIDSYPFAGSALVLWDTGSPVSPITNTPPRDGDDPHEDPRRHLPAIEQIDHFLRTGEVIDVCGGAPCVAPPT